MSTPATTTVIDVADLHRRPGTSRQVSVDVPADATVDLPLTALGGDVHVELLLEALADGVLARGRVTAPVTTSCARCLAERDDRLDVEVVELFADVARAREGELEEGYVVEESGGHPVVDLDVLVRDALAEAAADRPLCRPDCAGLCPGCGADRNIATCECDDDDVDDRWAALRTLQLPEARDDDPDASA